MGDAKNCPMEMGESINRTIRFSNRTTRSVCRFGTRAYEDVAQVQPFAWADAKRRSM